MRLEMIFLQIQLPTHQMIYNHIQMKIIVRGVTHHAS